MKLNPKKCKNLGVNFQRNLPSLPELSQLTINGTMIDHETVTNHKLLGLQIQDDLKWNDLNGLDLILVTENRFALL